jgi:sugar phosphate permease
VTLARRIVFIAALVIAGELVFGLPFHTARFFRPTLLDVFGFSNTQLGDIFAVYGITATLSFFPGGVLADHFSARKLITLALLATAVGGLYMATIPGQAQMALLYGYFGITTIFLSWGALIRATREWGGQSAQGLAFGLLESGRGLTAAVTAAIAVAVLATLLPDEVASATDEQRREGFRAVIFVYSIAAVLAGALVWFFIPDSDLASKARQNPFLGMAEVMRRPLIWAQAGIIVCAYCLFKGSDYYSLYAVQVLGIDEVSAARLASYGAYVRPVAALAAGFIADRFTASRSIGVAFAVALLTYLVLAAVTPQMVGLAVIVANICVSLFAVFALRGIYFALLEETKTPRHITGTSVGMVSFIGFTPDIFFAPIAGRILDARPGIGGHTDLFMLLGAIAAVGILVVVWLRVRYLVRAGAIQASRLE